MKKHLLLIPSWVAITATLFIGLTSCTVGGEGDKPEPTPPTPPLPESWEVTEHEMDKAVSLEDVSYAQISVKKYYIDGDYTITDEEVFSPNTTYLKSTTPSNNSIYEEYVSKVENNHYSRVYCETQDGKWLLDPWVSPDDFWTPQDVASDYHNFYETIGYDNFKVDKINECYTFDAPYKNDYGISSISFYFNNKKMIKLKTTELDSFGVKSVQWDLSYNVDTPEVPEIKPEDQDVTINLADMKNIISMTDVKYMQVHQIFDILTPVSEDSGMWEWNFSPKINHRKYVPKVGLYREWYDTDSESGYIGCSRAQGQQNWLETRQDNFKKPSSFVAGEYVQDYEYLTEHEEFKFNDEDKCYTCSYYEDEFDLTTEMSFYFFNKKLVKCEDFQYGSSHETISSITYTFDYYEDTFQLPTVQIKEKKVDNLENNVLTSECFDCAQDQTFRFSIPISKIEKQYWTSSYSLKVCVDEKTESFLLAGENFVAVSLNDEKFEFIQNEQQLQHKTFCLYGLSDFKYSGIRLKYDGQIQQDDILSVEVSLPANVTSQYRIYFGLTS